MKKKDLQSSAGISWASVTKLSKGETVSMEVLMKVCKALECNIGDIMDLIPEAARTAYLALKSNMQLAFVIKNPRFVKTTQNLKAKIKNASSKVT